VDSRMCLLCNCRSNDQTRQPQSACADFLNVVDERHICGVAHPGGAMTPHSNSAEIFAQCTYFLKFYHPNPMFARSEVIVLTKQTHPPTNKHTNKQIPLKTSNVFRYTLRRWVIT